MDTPLDLTIDLNGIDNSRPVLLAGVYEMVIKSVEILANKQQTGRNMLVEFATVHNETSVSGQKEGKQGDVNPGFTVRKYYPLQQSENPKAPDFRKDLCFLHDAVHGTTAANRGGLDPASYVDQHVMVKLRVESDETYGDQNSVNGVLPLQG